MTRSEAIKLMKLFEQNYTVYVGGHPYVDTPANEICFSEDDDDIVYSSSVFDDRSLTDVATHNVKVLQVIDNWQEIPTQEI